MKTTPSSRPRLFCQVVRRWSVVVDRGGAPHAASCADCRAYFAATQDFEAALRRDAGAWAQLAPTPSVGFEQRVAKAVARAKAPATVIRSHTWHGAWAAAASLAVVAALVVFRPASGPTPDDLRAKDALGTGAVQAVSRGLVETVIPTTGALVANNPMQREFDAIYSDARSALGFMALNFLPAGSTE